MQKLLKMKKELKELKTIAKVEISKMQIFDESMNENLGQILELDPSTSFLSGGQGSGVSGNNNF